MSSFEAPVALLPQLERQVRFLRDSSLACEVKNVRSGVPNAEGPGDRFTLYIPYCASEIKCEVVFNAICLDCPPDFIFDDEECEIPLDDFSTLSTWSITQHDSLFSIVADLKEKYKLYQQQKMLEVAHQRLRFDYDSSLHHCEGVECLVTGANHSQVRFLIPLKIRTPAGPVGVHLQVVYHVYSDSRSPDATLVMSEDASCWLGSDIQLPQWAEEAMLVEYRALVDEQLQKRSEGMLAAFFRRRAFFLALKADFPGIDLEVDVTMSRLCFLVAPLGPPAFVVIVTVPRNFPEQQPTLTAVVAAERLARGNRPVTKVYTQYPYSPRWTPQDLARRIRIFLLEEACDDLRRIVGETCS